VLAYEDVNGHITLVDLASMAVKRLPNVGSMPVFSPDGSKIAYIGANQDSGGLFMTAADGSGVRAVSPSGHTYSVLGGLSWSPDGTWLLAVGSSGVMEIVRPSDSMAMQLKSIGSVVQASWGNQ
jgi:Tol biopolymer transport system component